MNNKMDFKSSDGHSSFSLDLKDTAFEGSIHNVFLHYELHSANQEFRTWVHTDYNNNYNHLIHNILRGNHEAFRDRS